MPEQSPQDPQSPQELPPLTLKNILNDCLHGAHALVYSPALAIFAAILIMLFESAALTVIINKVPYTEIDFKTYMQQVELISNGELDYSQVTGDTGALVYPAGHVQIYQLISWLSNGGSDFAMVQGIFRYLYLATHLLTLSLYFLVFQDSQLQPWAVYLLALSKRLHSIYVLRLFNDCFTTATSLGAVLLLALLSYHKKSSNFESLMLTIIALDIYSMSVSIKMNALLYLPGFLVVVYLLCDENLLKMLLPLFVLVSIQVMPAFKFLMPFDFSPEALQIRAAYLNLAFDFKRVFLYKWTVNWKFVPKELFLDRKFHLLLLTLHLLVLSLFFVTKILTPRLLNKSLTQFLLDGLKFWKSTLPLKSIIRDSKRGPKFVFIAMAMSNLIGVLFSRSLHYQFLAWYAHSLPALLLVNRFPVPVNVLIFALHEYSWNVYPSTVLSSGVLVGTLVVVVAGVWTGDLFPEEVDEEKKRK